MYYAVYRLARTQSVAVVGVGYGICRVGIACEPSRISPGERRAVRPVRGIAYRVVGDCRFLCIKTFSIVLRLSYLT